MHSFCTTCRQHFAMTLIAVLVVFLALGRPLDDAAHAASAAVEAGSTSPLLKFIAAFDVIDDPADHQGSENPYEKTQLVIQLAMPEANAIGSDIVTEKAIAHAQRLRDVVTSRSPQPLERPPRA